MTIKKNKEKQRNSAFAVRFGYVKVLHVYEVVALLPAGARDCVESTDGWSVGCLVKVVQDKE